MPRQKHFYGLNHLHYITRSTYHRARLFDSERFKRQWIGTLNGLRSELKFKISTVQLKPEQIQLFAGVRVFDFAGKVGNHL